MRKHDYCQTVCVLLTVFLTACTTDSYDKGTGKDSLVQGDFTEVAVDAQCNVVTVATDEGAVYVPASSYTASWITKGDTTYRAIAYFDIRDAQHIAIHSLTRMPTLIPRKAEDFKRQPEDPLGIESIWLTKNARYINIGLLLKNGRIDDEEGVHALAVVDDALIQHADQKRTSCYRLLHDQGTAPEYYTNRRYVSILLPADMPDTIRLTIPTYEGSVVRTIPVR
jgi:hypothetical protein